MTESIGEQIMRDLQRKVNDDVFDAIRRTSGLVDSNELRVWLALQAACTAICTMSQMIEQHHGRKPAPPLPTTVLLACLMCARCYEIPLGCTLEQLLRAADRDVADMMQAGIIKKTHGKGFTG